MCLKTHYHIRQNQESFLRKHHLFEMLICEIYNLLTLYRPKNLNSRELFEELSPFLKSRLLFVTTQEETTDFFNNEFEMIEYVANLLSDKIHKIHIHNNCYFCEIESS